MRIRAIIITVALLFTSIGLYAQSYSAKGQHNYDKNVQQYCYRTSSHPSYCSTDYDFEKVIYCGVIMSKVSGDIVNENLWGLDIGCKFTNLWGYTCSPVRAELNAAVDIKFATQFSEENECAATDYALQLTVTPGIRLNRFSIEAGPYIAYAALCDSREELLSPNVSGMDYGIRMGCTIHFEKHEIGLHYDMGLSDQNKQFKKNDLMLSYGFLF